MKTFTKWLLTAVMGALPAMALTQPPALDSVTGGYPFSVTQTGLPDRQSTSITISPNAANVGNPGSVYIFSIARNGSVFSFTPDSGWQQSTQTNPRLTNGLPSASVFSRLKPYGYYNKIPATIAVTPIQNQNVGDLIGKTIYAGYGRNATEMYRQGTYSAVTANVPQLPRPGLTICKDIQFALCASSTCKAIPGKTITDNQGFTFPAASCECPIVRADAIADLKVGNQVGSCVSPEPGVVYSVFGDVDTYPQYVGGTWQEEPAAAPGVCPGQQTNSNGTTTTSYYAQCWNFRCEVIAPQDGFPLARCTCPMQTSIKPTGYWLEGSSNNPCTSIPVGIFAPTNYDPTTTTQ